ncbi:MAG: hypothetical protein ACFFCZ_12300 [Promethearchaeota archaeon]
MEDITNLIEKLEQSLFGGQLEEKFFEGRTSSTPLFSDLLEKSVFFILLDLALSGKIGATSALLAEMTKKTKNTVNVRLERLYYKRLIQRQEIGNALLYYVPLHELLLSAIAKELAKIKVAGGEIPETASEEEIEKEILTRYVTDVNLILGRSKGYFESISEKTDLELINLKKELLKK